MLVARLEAKEEISYRYNDNPWFNPPVAVDAVSKKATVIGAGIAGLSVAYSLVKRGWNVTLLDEKKSIASGASANPAAIIYPRISVNNDVDTEFYTTAYCHTLYVLKLLQSKFKQKFWFDDGLLQKMDEARFLKIINNTGFNKEFVSKHSFSVQQDELSAKGKKAVFVNYPSAGVVLPKILCGVLVEECGNRLNIVHAEVDDIKFKNNSWQCLSGDSIVSETEVLVIANGSKINACGLDINFPVESIRGQVVELNNSKKFNIKSTINSDVYITPKINKQHYLGATYSRDNRSIEIDDNDNKVLLKSFDEINHGVFDMSSINGAWVGFRAMSKDRAAIVGAVPDQQHYRQEYADIRDGKINKYYSPASYLNGLYVTAAHGSRGFTSSFLSAELIASQIEGEPAPVSKAVLDYLQPSRFIVNDLKRR